MSLAERLQASDERRAEEKKRSEGVVERRKERYLLIDAWFDRVDELVGDEPATLP